MPLSTNVLKSYRLKADPLADKVIADIIASSEVEGINNLFLQLRNNDDLSEADLPDSVKIYFEETKMLPEWIDQKKVLAGQKVFAKHGPQISLSLLCKSLPEAYACKNGEKYYMQQADYLKKMDL